jgi:hypothetical protein
MAYITEFHASPSGGESRQHSTCTAGWRLAERSGERVVQIDTYGSPERQDAGTVSQSLQLDEARARELVAILCQTFPSI